jgi:hypothetical protein
MFIAPFAGGTVTTSNPGVDHPAITNGHSFGIRAEGYHFAKDFMTEHQSLPAHIQLLAGTQFKHAVVQMDIRVTHPAGYGF